MTLPLLIRRSLRQHLLSTLVTALSLALASGLLMTVWALKHQARQTFERMDGGWDAVLGARSSKLQLVLNAVFHLEASPGNIKPTDLATLAANPAVREVVPIAMGDNYQGFRIVGTSTNHFTDHEYAPGRRFRVQEGRLFDDGYREAVIGAFAAQRLGFKTGTEFKPYHGLNYASNPRDNVQHDDTYVVVGILEPSNTPADRVIWIPVAGLQNMAGHDPATAQDVSAALVKLRDPAAGFRLDQLYNKQGDKLTLAWPIGAVMAQLFDKIGWFDQVLALVAWLVALVAAASVRVGETDTSRKAKQVREGAADGLACHPEDGLVLHDRLVLLRFALLLIEVAKGLLKLGVEAQPSIERLTADARVPDH
jgi:putative ABC transport system permease protein